jgi:hypothetical protein
MNFPAGFKQSICSKNLAGIFFILLSTYTMSRRIYCGFDHPEALNRARVFSVASLSAKRKTYERMCTAFFTVIVNSVDTGDQCPDDRATAGCY